MKNRKYIMDNYLNKFRKKSYYLIGFILMYLNRRNLFNGFFLIFRMAHKKNIKAGEQTFDEFLVQIGERLKKRRQAIGFSSYEQFAYEHNIGRAQYGKYEKGTEDLRLSSLHKVLEALDISWEEFFRGL